MKKIPVYKFYKHKYGDELLVDVISYEKMMPDIRRTLVFSETFYSITLVLEADATVAVNGKSRRLKKGLIICSIPGEVWAFDSEPKIEALNLMNRLYCLVRCCRTQWYSTRGTVQCLATSWCHGCPSAHTRRMRTPSAPSCHNGIGSFFWFPAHGPLHQ